ncbi:MAG: hypothetical protein EBT26_01975 [Microbacteriaceae bacterium]|nr:hypothetical protein [Microbacteriaceae bacterium]NBS60812.1 hypothetical protein [Microbacteriaceae bacterium]
MANKVILKKSSVVGKVPLAADLDYGEVAINYADGKLFYKKTDNTIAEISGAGGVGNNNLQTRRVYEFTATNNQTTFSVPNGYIVGGIDVIINGSLLASTDYTATNGTTVVLAENAVAGDFIRIVALDSPTATELSNFSIAMAIALG